MCLVGGETGERGVDLGRRDEGRGTEGRGIAFHALEALPGFRRCEDGGLEEDAPTAERGDCGGIVSGFAAFWMDSWREAYALSG